MTESERAPLGGIAIIVMVGVLLGVGYNALGRRDPRGWGLDWVGQDRLESMLEMETVGAAAPAGDTISSLYSGSDDPLAPARPSGGAAAAIPEIPAIGRAVPIDAAALKQLVDASAALVVDARDAEEFAAGHIRGAINLPFDEAITDPVRLESLDTAGRPIVTYCGIGIRSAFAAQTLTEMGFTNVRNYEEGLVTWESKGYPVAR